MTEAPSPPRHSSFLLGFLNVTLIGAPIVGLALAVFVHTMADNNLLTLISLFLLLGYGLLQFVWVLPLWWMARGRSRRRWGIAVAALCGFAIIPLAVLGLGAVTWM